MYSMKSPTTATFGDCRVQTRTEKSRRFPAIAKHRVKSLGKACAKVDANVFGRLLSRWLVAQNMMAAVFLGHPVWILRTPHVSHDRNLSTLWSRRYAQCTRCPANRRSRAWGAVDKI